MYYLTGVFNKLILLTAFSTCRLIGIIDNFVISLKALSNISCLDNVGVWKEWVESSCLEAESNHLIYLPIATVGHHHHHRNSLEWQFRTTNMQCYLSQFHSEMPPWSETRCQRLSLQLRMQKSLLGKHVPLSLLLFILNFQTFICPIGFECILRSVKCTSYPCPDVPMCNTFNSIFIIFQISPI